MMFITIRKVVDSPAPFGPRNLLGSARRHRHTRPVPREVADVPLRDEGVDHHGLLGPKAPVAADELYRITQQTIGRRGRVTAEPQGAD